MLNATSGCRADQTTACYDNPDVTCNISPDATMTLRFSDGRVKGYEYNGTLAPWATTFYGLYGRGIAFGNNYPFDIPDAWLQNQAKIDLSKIDAMEEKAGKTSSDEGSNEAADEKTEQASSDEDSRSAASAEESAEQEEDGGGSDIADADAPLPFRTRGDGPIHLQNFLSPAGAVPYCRNAPYTGYVQEDKGAWDELCLNCKRRLPKGIFRKLRRSGGVG